MILNLEELDIFVKPGATDMRKQINGLAILVQEELEQDPFNGALFLFSNRQRRLLKILYWDRNGFCLWMKKLDKDKFPWPENETKAREITYEQLEMLLKGIDFWNAHKSVHYTTVF